MASDSENERTSGVESGSQHHAHAGTIRVAQGATKGAERTYPTAHVVGIVDTPGQLATVMTALADGGFLASELEARCGTAEAERLAATTGRTGLLDGVLRLAERLGIQNDELAVKQRYEDALRAGHYVVTVHTPTDDRKALAATLLADRGAHFVNYFGRLTREALDG